MNSSAVSDSLTLKKKYIYIYIWMFVFKTCEATWSPNPHRSTMRSRRKPPKPLSGTVKRSGVWPSQPQQIQAVWSKPFYELQWIQPVPSSAWMASQFISDSDHENKKKGMRELEGAPWINTRISPALSRDASLSLSLDCCEGNHPLISGERFPQGQISTAWQA